MKTLEVFRALSFLSMALVFFPKSPLGAQSGNGEVWQLESKPGTFLEGRMDVPVSRPDLELISFVGFREDSYDEDIDLKVRFWLWEDTRVFVIARELEEREQYRMEAEPFGWKKEQWNEWGPWPTGAWLRRANIPPWNLGLVVRLQKKTGSKIAPAFVHHTGLPKSVSNYSLHLRPNNGLSGLSYSVTHEGEVVMQKDLDVRAYAGEPVEIRLNARDLPEEGGLLKIKIVARMKNRADAAIREYEFYHQPHQPRS